MVGKRAVAWCDGAHYGCRIVSLSEIFTIGKRPSPRQFARTGKQLRVNHQIRTSPIRLIDDNNEQIGVVDLEDALRRAHEAQLDLVEVSPMSSPPVCRVMDYGKWKYQQKKKEQKNRSNAKQSELKEVRLRPKIDVHDLNIKLDKAREFFEEGHKVQFTMQFRGREMAHQDLGRRTMTDICDTMAEVSKVETPPRMAGRRMTMVLAPDRSNKQADAKPKSKPAAPTPSAPTADEATPAPQTGTA